MILGIDLGTTNSLASVWQDGQIRLIPNALGQVLTPSCVSLASDGQVLVGQAARDRLLTEPDRTAAAFKRYMGTEKRLRLGSRDFRPEELSAIVLKSLKADAEAYLGEAVDEAVITVPAYFNDTQRKATRAAGQLAGLKVERLLNEPTAAALAYGLHRADPQSQFLIFDLGGGTFDVSVMEMFGGVMEVRASAGDNFLGGEDFVQVLVDGFLDQVGRKGGVDSRKPTVMARLRTEAERVKRELSFGDAQTFGYRDGKRDLAWPVTQESFERLSAVLLQRLRRPIERALHDAKITASSLSRIVLVGGATRMPIVHRLVAKMFGRFPSRDIDPDQAIAMGAAIQAGLKAQDAALDEVVMTDVCPYSLGVEVTEHISARQARSGIFLPIIERNTVIPASRSKTVSPVHANQTEIEVRVYQGESHEVSENILLGTLTVPLPALDRSKQQVELRFTYDINGLLEVEAEIAATKATRSLVIEQNPGALTPDQVQRSLEALASLKIHPRDQTENRAMLERLRHLHELHLGAQREWVALQLRAFEAVLSQQDPRDIALARTELAKALQQFDAVPRL